MGFFNFLDKKQDRHFFDVVIAPKANELYIKELMINHAIDLIAKTIAKSEIEVYMPKNGKVEKIVDDFYYMLNVRPNWNANGTTFMYEVVDKLFREGEVLIVQPQEYQLHIADRFKVSDNIMEGKIYNEIYIYDDYGNEYKLNDTFFADDVVHLHLGNKNITRTLDNFYKEYAEMIAASAKGYTESQNKKYRLTPPIGTNVPLKDPKTGEDISHADVVDKLTEGLKSGDRSVMLLPAHYDFEILEGKYDKDKDTDDYLDLIKDFGDKVAMAFNIPLEVFYGTQTDKSNSANDFITFAVSPIIEIIEDGLNAKLMSKKLYLEGARFKFNTFSMKHFDIMDVANSLDKLFAIGWSHDDLREILNLPKIDAEWSRRHHVTKNYMDVNETLERGE